LFSLVINHFLKINVFSILLLKQWLVGINYRSHLFLELVLLYLSMIQWKHFLLGVYHDRWLTMYIDFNDNDMLRYYWSIFIYKLLSAFENKRTLELAQTLTCINISIRLLHGIPFLLKFDHQLIVHDIILDFCFIIHIFIFRYWLVFYQRLVY